MYKLVSKWSKIKAVVDWNVLEELIYFNRNLEDYLEHNNDYVRQQVGQMLGSYNFMKERECHFFRKQLHTNWDWDALTSQRADICRLMKDIEVKKYKPACAVLDELHKYERLHGNLVYITNSRRVAFK